MPQFETTFWTNHIFWLLISFTMLYTGIHCIIFPIYERIFKERDQLIQLPLKKAEKLVNETLELQNKFNQKKEAFFLQNEKKLNSVYQTELKKLEIQIEELKKSQLKTFKKNIQKIENDEKLVLKNIPNFTQKVIEEAK